MSSSKPNERKERRAARRKTQILEAAAQVFAEKGFHRATTKEIAEAADVAEGTIYNYFENKDDLLISLIDWLADLRNRRESYVQALDEDVRQAFHRLVYDRFTAVKDRNVLFLAVLPEILSTPRLRDLYRQRIMVPALRDLEEHFNTRVERNEIQNVDVPVMIRMLTALSMGLEFLTILGDPDTQAIWEDTERFTDLVTHVVFDGMMSASGSAPDAPE